jgi:hypothetical protein
LRTVDDKTKAHLLIFCSQKSLRVTAPVPRVSIIMVVVIVVAAVVAFVVSRVKYLSELEPPAKYNHPLCRWLNACTLYVSGCFRSLCSLRMGEQWRLPYCLTER